MVKGMEDKGDELGSLIEVLEIFAENREIKDPCSNVAFTEVAQYAADHKFEETELCLENVIDLKQKVPLIFKEGNNANDRVQIVSAMDIVFSSVKATYKECKKTKKVVLV